jgi:DNA-directed RNA polymerase specialized sigma24 family protein
MTDQELLDQFVSAGSQAAFAELVARHLDWVFGVACRAVGGDAHLAEDVTQATFIVRARKAATIAPGTVLTARLFRVVRYTAAAARRAEGRRRRHEKRSAAMFPRCSVVNPWDDPGGAERQRRVEPAPDDRRAVLLRFYRRKSFRAVGEALGVSEEAARKRVGRAVDRLRTRLHRRGAGAAAPAPRCPPRRRRRVPA